jgi:hypothetical protein
MPAPPRRPGDTPLDLRYVLDGGPGQAAVPDQLAARPEDHGATSESVGPVAGEVPLDPGTGAVSIERIAPAGERLGIAQERSHLVEIAQPERPERESFGLEVERRSAHGCPPVARRAVILTHGVEGERPVWVRFPPATARRCSDDQKEDGMSDSIYRVTEVIGTSTVSWEDAAKNAVETAAKTLRDLRVGEVMKLDLTIEGGKVTNYRARVSISFKYEAK